MKVIFKCNNSFQNFLRLKDKEPNNLLFHHLHKYTCNKRKAINIGKRDIIIWSVSLNILESPSKTHNMLTYNPNSKNTSAILSHINYQKCVGDI